MPPQETNVTSEAGGDAAGLYRELAIALRRDATGDGLAGARPTPMSAALIDALSEKQAAGRPAASMRNVLSLLKGCWRALWEWRQRERLRVNLHDLSDRELNDIGLTRGEIDYMAAHRTIERLRDGTAHLWISGGMM